MSQIVCPHCGTTTTSGPAKCPTCDKPFAGGKSPARTELEARGANPGMVLFMILSVPAGAFGFLLLTPATQGVGVLALAILFAAYARIAQAGALHDRVEQLQAVAKRP